MIPPRKRPRATRAILTAIFIGFAIEIYTGAWTDPVKLALLGAVIRDFIFDYGQYWRLVSAMFLHGNGTIPGAILHLVMNVLALVQIGALYEGMFGTRRFLTVYFITGIAASLTTAIVREGPSVGASGAIFGIIGAFILSVWRSPRYKHERFARSIVNQLVFWALANLAIASQIPQIDNAAHLGGLITGALLGLILPHAAPPPPPPAEMVIDVRPYDP